MHTFIISEMSSAVRLMVSYQLILFPFLFQLILFLLSLLAMQQLMICNTFKDYEFLNVFPFHLGVLTDSRHGLGTLFSFDSDINKTNDLILNLTPENSL